MDYIPLEKPIAELEIQIEELQRMAATQGIDLDSEIKKLEAQSHKLRVQLFSALTPYEMTQLSRHPKRPNTLEMIDCLIDSFIELHGDRNFYDDKAIVCGLGYLGTRKVAIIGHQKGKGTKGNIERNFGMAKPEGYRKALRIMSLAERFQLPILTFIDTPGAYPGIDAEERGQSEAIGKNIMVMSKLRVPILTVVLGEGGSGGALAIGIGNRVHMLQYSTYSVISPEGCASILMKDARKAPQAANALKLTADSALEFGVIDSVISEPLGGAHRDPRYTAQQIRQTLEQDLGELAKFSGEELAQQRMEKFLQMGRYEIFKGESA